jgi:hypothetical protein
MLEKTTISNVKGMWVIARWEPETYYCYRILERVCTVRYRIPQIKVDLVQAGGRKILLILWNTRRNFTI